MVYLVGMTKIFKFFDDNLISFITSSHCWTGIFLYSGHLVREDCDSLLYRLQPPCRSLVGYSETENLRRLNLSKSYVKIAIGHKVPYWFITFILKEINPQKLCFWLAQMFV